MTPTILMISVASIVACVAIASTKDFNRYLAFTLGLFLGPIGVLIVALEPAGVKASTPRETEEPDKAAKP